MKKIRCYFDLDRTLYDTDAMFGPIRDDLIAQGYTKTQIKEASNVLSQTGYSFEAHLRALGITDPVLASKMREYAQRLQQGDSFLITGVLEMLYNIHDRAEPYLLTFGFPPFQQEKVRGIPSLLPFLRDSHFVWQDQSKGDVLRDAGDEARVIFVDDTPSHLQDARAKAPWVTCVRMMHPHFHLKSHPEDGKEWEVCENFSSLERIVLGGYAGGGGVP